MVSKRLFTVLSASILVVVIIVALFLFSLQRGSPFTNQNPFQTVQKAILEVAGRVAGGYWIRNETTDLPEYVSAIAYSISNVGNKAADSVDITIKNGEAVYSTRTLQLLAADSRAAYELTATTSYDAHVVMSIQALCTDSSDSYSLSIGQAFPRYWSADSTMKLFITPKESNLVRMRNEIVNYKFFLLPNWIAIRDWIGNNIEYRDDSVVHGTGEFWQFSKETLTLGTGDCEDFAILVCSLLRAYDYSPNDVYVVIGKKGEALHAWAKVNLGVLGWYNLEPQQNGWSTLIGDFLSLSGYQAVYEFNEVYSRPVG